MFKKLKSPQKVGKRFVLLGLIIAVMVVGIGFVYGNPFDQNNQRVKENDVEYAHAYTNIIGRVVDEETGKGVEGVLVRLLNTEGEYAKEMTKRTDKSGRYILENVPVFEDMEYELMIRGGCLDMNSRWCKDKTYFRQEYIVKFRLRYGRNMKIKTIKLKRGKSIRGKVKLRNGKRIKDVSIEIHLKKIKPYDSIDYGWRAYLKEDRIFVSELLPIGEELYFIVDSLEDEEGVHYGSFTKEIKLEKDKEYNDLEFIMPERNTEISGRITDINGKPIEGKQKISILPDNGYNIDIVVDRNGYFKIKEIQEGNFRFDLYLLINKKFTIINYNKQKEKIKIRRGEKIFLDIKVDTKKKAVRFSILK